MYALADTLENYKAGTMLPSFPNIFGSNGLIPKLPPIIEEANKLYAQGCLAGAINNFNSAIPIYGEVYKEIFDDGSNQQLFGGPDRASSFNVYVNTEDFPARPYVLGYTSDATLQDVEEVSKHKLGPYVFGSDIDVTGIKRYLHSANGPKSRNKEGESSDDEKFEQLVNQLSALDNGIVLAQGMQGLNDLDVGDTRRLSATLSNSLGRSVQIVPRDDNSYDVTGLVE